MPLLTLCYLLLTIVGCKLESDEMPSSIAHPPILKGEIETDPVAEALAEAACSAGVDYIAHISEGELNIFIAEPNTHGCSNEGLGLAKPRGRARGRVSTFNPRSIPDTPSTSTTKAAGTKPVNQPKVIPVVTPIRPVHPGDPVPPAEVPGALTTKVLPSPPYVTPPGTGQWISSRRPGSGFMIVNCLVDNPKAPCPVSPVFILKNLINDNLGAVPAKGNMFFSPRASPGLADVLRKYGADINNSKTWGVPLTSPPLLQAANGTEIAQNARSILGLQVTGVVPYRNHIAFQLGAR